MRFRVVALSSDDAMALAGTMGSLLASGQAIHSALDAWDSLLFGCVWGMGLMDIEVDQDGVRYSTELQATPPPMPPSRKKSVLPAIIAASVGLGIAEATALVDGLLIVGIIHHRREEAAAAAELEAVAQAGGEPAATTSSSSSASPASAAAAGGCG